MFCSQIVPSVLPPACWDTMQYGIFCLMGWPKLVIIRGLIFLFQQQMKLTHHMGQTFLFRLKFLSKSKVLLRHLFGFPHKPIPASQSKSHHLIIFDVQPINDIREKLIVMQLHNKPHGQCDAVFFYRLD